MVTFMFVAVLLVVYLVIHAIDRTRGIHVALIEQRLTDGSWATHELVRRGNHLRLMTLVWNHDWTRVRRRRILTTCPGTASTREAISRLSAASGLELRAASETYARYVSITQSLFQTA